MKKTILILSLFLSIGAMAQELPQDTTPKYLLMFGSKNIDTIKAINETVMAQAIKNCIVQIPDSLSDSLKKQQIAICKQSMQQWDDIHTDTVTFINFINTPDLSRIGSLPDLQIIKPYLDTLEIDVYMFQQGFISLNELNNKIQLLLVEIDKQPIDANTKFILNSLIMENYNRTKITLKLTK